MTETAMDQPPSYLIRTIEDFGKVPPERLGQCLKEFAIALSHARDLAARLAPLDAKMTEFRWTDDGIEERTSAHVTMGSGVEP